MAMENSASLSNDSTKELSSSTKEDFPPAGSVIQQQGGSDHASQKSSTEENNLETKSKDTADPEGDFVDAESVADEANMAAPIAGNASSSEAAADEDVADDDENGSVESYDSALERIAVASTGDPTSPEAPSSPAFQPAETAQQIALRQLNQMNSGVSSLDPVLLQNTSTAEFKTRVIQIAQMHGLPADSEDVVHILTVLLPLVEGDDSKPVIDVGDVGSEGADDLKVPESAEGSKPDNSSLEGSNGDVPTSERKASEELKEEGDAQDVHNDDKTDEKTAAVTEIGDDSSKGSKPVDFLKKSVDNDEEASKSKDYDLEPEVIDWDALNESDADDLNAQSHTSVADESKGLVGEVSSDSAGLEQVEKISNAENVVPVSAEAPQSAVNGEEPKGSEVSEPPPSVADDSKEFGGGVGVDSAGLQQEGRTLDAEYVAPKSAEIQQSTESRELPKRSEVSEEEGASAALEGTKDGQEPATAQVHDMKGNEPELSPEKSDITKGEEEESKPGLPVVEAAGDVSAKEEDPTLNIGSFVPSSHDSEQDDNGESPIIETTADVSSKEEIPMDSAASAGESKFSTGAGNEAATSLDGAGSSSPAVIPAVLERSVPSLDDAPPVIDVGDDVSSKENKFIAEKSSPAASVGESKASTATGNDAATSLGGAGPSLPARPAGLGRSVPSLEHAPRAVQRSSGASASARQAAATEEDNGASITDVTEGTEDAREKLQMIRVKFLRLANRLGQSAHNVVVAQVLYRLGLAEQLRGGQGVGRTGAFAFERASVLAEEQEAAGEDDLEFGCTIMVLGKSGVGKSATINSLFDEVKSGTDAYSPATNKVQEIIGTVHGIKLRVIDTPGLLTSFADQRRNERIMSSVKRFIKKSPPDIVLYFDRLDMQSRDYGDLPLLRTITDTFGSAVWFNAIVVLTHASSAPPDGANGVPVSYEMFVAQRSHVVQQTIRQAAGDMRLMNPVSLVENHAACRRNRVGERVLPNGQVWKPQLLLLCFASKILAEANSLLKLQDNSPAKPFGVRSKVPPLPFLLSSLLQSRAQLKLPDEQIGSDDESDDESEEEADSEGEEEYDDLPPFRRLTKDELKLLDKEQRKIYAEELEYREKLFMKKQLKDERARKKEMKRRMAALPKEAAHYVEESYEEENASASVPVPMPDMALPPSFDSDNPTYRYRYLDNANQWLVRPVLETHGWDHDSGYDGLNVEKMFVVSKKVPVSVSGQVTKDKKEANLQMECAASFKNGEGKFTQAGLDIQTIGKDLAYTLRSETRFDNFKRNKTTCGLAVTLLGDTLAAGMKIEDRLLIGRRVKLVFNGGALTGRGDVAYGGSLEATIKDKDYPIGQFLSTFGLSVMDWHGDLAIGGNLQVHCKLGKTMTIVRGNLNNRRAGQISVRVSSSEQLQIALIGLIPLLRMFINNRILSST